MTGRDELLRELAAAQDEVLLRESVVAGTKVRLRQTLDRRARRRLAWPLVLGVATAGAVALVVVARSSPLTFAVGETRVRGEIDAPVVAAETRPVDLLFSDGSSLALAPRGRARVTSIDNHGAAILVERGRADVSVVPRKNGSWRVDVGPFAIHVKGTRFSIDWDPDSERLDFHLQKGAVVITAPCLQGGRSLVAGESLQASCRARTAEPAPAIAAPAPPAARVDARPSGRARGEPTSTWRQLADDQDYRGALAAAVRFGFDRELRVSSSADLLVLGDVARLAGDPDRALRAYEAAHRKNPVSVPDRSAFAIGLIQFDQRRQFRSAAESFAAYLAEQPDGSLSEEAQGRLMEAWERAGEPAKARAVGTSYLARHPRGQYADLARRLTR